MHTPNMCAHTRTTALQLLYAHRRHTTLKLRVIRRCVGETADHARKHRFFFRGKKYVSEKLNLGSDGFNLIAKPVKPIGQSCEINTKQSYIL